MTEATMVPDIHDCTPWLKVDKQRKRIEVISSEFEEQSTLLHVQQKNEPAVTCVYVYFTF